MTGIDLNTGQNYVEAMQNRQASHNSKLMALEKYKSDIQSNMLNARRSFMNNMMKDYIQSKTGMTTQDMQKYLQGLAASSGNSLAERRFEQSKYQFEVRQAQLEQDKAQKALDAERKRIQEEKDRVQKINDKNEKEKKEAEIRHQERVYKVQDSVTGDDSFSAFVEYSKGANDLMATLSHKTSKNIPGWGSDSFRRALFNANAFEAFKNRLGFKPNTEEGKLIDRLKQQVQFITKAYQLAMSGRQSTDKEYQVIQEIIGSSTFSSDDQLRYGLRSLAKVLKKKFHERTSGYGPEVQADVFKNMGLHPKDFDIDFGTGTVEGSDPGDYESTEDLIESFQ
jgi:hypothetical protein